MDLCIKTALIRLLDIDIASFNPCFNGSMYKNSLAVSVKRCGSGVSILVLMDLCIKTALEKECIAIVIAFQSLF